MAYIKQFVWVFVIIVGFSVIEWISEALSLSAKTQSALFIVFSTVSFFAIIFLTLKYFRDEKRLKIEVDKLATSPINAIVKHDNVSAFNSIWAIKFSSGESAVIRSGYGEGHLFLIEQKGKDGIGYADWIEGEEGMSVVINKDKFLIKNVGNKANFTFQNNNFELYDQKIIIDGKASGNYIANNSYTILNFSSEIIFEAKVLAITSVLFSSLEKQKFLSGYKR